jgi:ATP-binding cassette subfamily A (ABC1) protein 3
MNSPFFLKNCLSAEMEAEIDSLLTDLQLQPKRNDLAKTLSGGQKRRLSVAIALIGKSKVSLC